MYCKTDENTIFTYCY